MFSTASLYINFDMQSFLCRLPFRQLVRKYDCDLCFTPMIISDSFVRSERARESDFTTSLADRPLIVQFAANKAEDWANATRLVAPYCDGVDLNCGCPQRWAMAEGYGACLIHKPDLVADMVKQTRNAVPDSQFCVSVKMRIHSDKRRSVDFCRQLESAGVSFLTVHSRTATQRGDPIDLEILHDIRQSVTLPIVANGDIKCLDDANMICQQTGVHGVMSARGILANPTLYTGESCTSLDCVKDWVKIATEIGTPFACFHHHLIYMCEKSLTRNERKFFNILSSTSAVVDFLRQKYGLQFD